MLNLIPQKIFILFIFEAGMEKQNKTEKYSLERLLPDLGRIFFHPTGVYDWYSKHNSEMGYGAFLTSAHKKWGVLLMLQNTLLILFLF